MDKEENVIHQPSKKGGREEYDRLATTEAGLDWMVEDAERFMEEDEGEGEGRIGGEVNDEDNEEGLDTVGVMITDNMSMQSQDTSRGGIQSSIWKRCLLPDNRLALLGVDLLDGSPAIKLFKFLAITFASICFFYNLIRFMVRQDQAAFMRSN
jgi:hypothetical protein